MIGKIKRALAKKVGQIVAESLIPLEQQTQAGLLVSYRTALRQGVNPIDKLTDAGFRCYSEYEEDGIILYLLAVVGMRSRKVVELCCGNGRECMSANLIINHGFKGYLFDGGDKNIKDAVYFFDIQKDCRFVKPSINKVWITKDNVNDLLRSAGAEGEVDLLSLDIDGNDYYIWQAIDAINPRVCVFETHNLVPGDASITIPYQDDFFAWNKTGPEVDFRSVSLAAMKKLSAAKGYTLVGGHKHGFNVFFVRNDLMNDFLHEASIAEVHDNEGTRAAQKERWPLVKNMPWVEV
jgi:hypothetical protein